MFGGSGSRVFLEYATQTKYSKKSRLGVVHKWLAKHHMLPREMYKRALVSIGVYTRVPHKELIGKNIFVHPLTRVCYSVRSYALCPVILLPLNFLGGTRIDRYVPMKALLPYMYQICTQFS